jgi:hypothetical protein
VKRSLGSALVLLVLAVSGAKAGSPVPHAVTASYDVFRNDWRIAVVNETFEAKQNGYRIVSESSAVGLLALFERHPLRLVSTGSITASGLRPQHFEGKRSEADRRQVRAEFDWQAGELTLTHHGRTEILPLLPGTQDRLSLGYQFMFVAFDRRRSLEFAMTNGRKLDRYRYAVHHGVEIDTPLGRMTTLHLVKQREPEGDGTEIWLAPHLNYLPVKLLVEDNDGPRYEQVVTRIELTRP